MLKIIRSKHSSSGREAFCHEISQLVGAGKLACLIVPEQQTVMAESLMSRILPPSSVLCFEVTNFTRLANTTFRTLGGLCGEYCDSVKKALLMWRTLTELSPCLTVTSGRREINAGLVESSLAAIGQMQSFGIHPGDLSEIADHDKIKSDGRLAGKINDLAKIYSFYKNLLSARYADVSDDAEAMINKLVENPKFLSDTSIFIEGFTSFTEPQYKLISILAARSSVSVALTLPKGMENSFEYTEIVGCEERLISGARMHGADIKLVREEGYGKKRNQALDEISPLLWSSNTNYDNITLQNKDDLRIFQARNPYEECEFVCQDIKRRVMSGESYSDFAIIARNADDYQGILDGALDRAKIPSFTSYRRDINEFEAIKLIYTAYAVARGFKREDVITYAKCTLSGISRAECDEFEIYVNKWQISGARFTSEDIWNMNPDGYTTRRNEETDRQLLRIHHVREKIVGPLSDFAERISEAHTVREQAEVLVRFLVNIDMEGSLKKRVEKLRELNETALAEGNDGLWKIICRSLDTLVTVLGDAPADAEAFLSQLKVVFSAVDIGRIPSYTDQLIVGSADMLRLYEKKHVYLIGVNAGKFPATISDKSYFSDRDRIKLNECGLAITPELEIKGARELYIFSRAFSYATDSVTLSYSSADTRFKAIEPSEVIEKISTLTGGAVKPIRIHTLPVSERIFTPESALSEIGEYEECYDSLREALVESGYEREISICEGDIENREVRLESVIVPSDKPIWMSQTSIDSYVQCPFKYYCKYVINLDKNETAEFDARNTGLFIHAVLENFFHSLWNEGRSAGDLTEDERAKLTKESVERHLGDLGDDMINASVKTKVRIDKLCRLTLPIVDGLCDEFAKSKFAPRFFELKFDFNESDAPDPIKIKAKSGNVIIKGTIDRVDAYQKGDDVYLRVIDYKTGKKSFDPDKLSEGMNLQMFIYLKGLVESKKDGFRQRLGVPEGGSIKPAGVVYVKTSANDTRIKTPSDQDALDAIKEAQRREGMVLDDQDVIDAMTVKYTPLYNPKTPDVIDSDKAKYMYTDDGWKAIMSTVEDAVCRVADGIRDGIMHADPKLDKKGSKTESACDYCEYKQICRTQ